MRISSLTCLLAGLGHGAILADAGAIPRGEIESASFVNTNSNSTDMIQPVSFRKIDWKVIRGGLKVGRDVVVVASGATVAIGTILGWIQGDSNKNSCSPIGGSGQSNDGKQKYRFKYWVTTTGKNCDTTAQTKTVAAALDDAWDQVHKYNYDWACIELSHGGTWHGHLAVATEASGMDVNTMCN